MRESHAAWDSSMPAIPDDATFNLSFTEADMPKSGS